MFTANLILNIYIMLKNILNLEGAAQLSKAQQNQIFGGEDPFIGGSGWCEDTCSSDSDCPDGMMGTTYSCKTVSCDNDDTKLCVKDV
jgi:hypothetical protein